MLFPFEYSVPRRNLGNIASLFLIFVENGLGIIDWLVSVSRISLLDLAHGQASIAFVFIPGCSHAYHDHSYEATNFAGLS